MDQVPYPGPSVLFHIRMVVLFIILATVDVVALGVAMNTIFTEGVGGTVLFANEVSPGHTPPSPAVDKPSVRNLVGQRLELYYQVLHQHYRVPPCTCAWWRDCASLGKQVYVFILHRALHRYAGRFHYILGISLMRRRFHETYNLPSVLLTDNREAWPSFEHDSGRIRHRSFVRHSIPRTYSISLGYA